MWSRTNQSNKQTAFITSCKFLWINKKVEPVDTLIYTPAAKSDQIYWSYEQYEISSPPPPHMAMKFVNLGPMPHHLPALEQDDSVLAQVKADIAVLVGVHGERKCRSHNAMPTWFVFLVKFPTYITCNILKKGNVSTFGSSQPTKKPTNQARKFCVLTYH